MSIREQFDQFITRLSEQQPDISIQVSVSFQDAGLTKSFHTGCGNWYSRQGMCHEFINMDIAREQAAQMAQFKQGEP